MKLTFSILLSLVSLITMAKPFALISGTPLDWQVEVTKAFLERHELDHEELVQWDLDNKECTVKNAVILQLCFKEEDLFVVSLQKEKLQKTLALLVSLEKAPENLTDEKEKRKKPSTGGQ